LNGGTWKVIIPNIFTAGATYTLPPSPLSVSSPCGGGDYHGTIFCGQQGLVCHEFIQAFPESDNYWASIYDSFGNLQGGGFIGNSSVDLFNRLSTSIPQPGGALYYKNGFNFANNFGSSGSNQQAFSTTQPFLNGSPGSLVCGSPNSNVYVSGINTSTVFPARDWGCPYIGASPDQTAQGITDVPGFFIFPDSVARLLSNDWFIDLPTNYGGTDNAAAYLSKQKKIYNVQTVNGISQTNWGEVYVASFDLTPFSPIPNITRGDFPGLANYHRAVSPRGIFQA
jgi:hypothetical protein